MIADITEVQLRRLERHARETLKLIEEIRSQMAGQRRPIKPTRLKATNFGSRVAELRRRRGLKQFELAERACIAPAQLSKIESGKTNPSIALAMDVARALGVRASDLLD